MPQSTLQFRLRSTPLPAIEMKLSITVSFPVVILNYKNQFYNHFSSHTDLLLQRVCGHSNFPEVPPVYHWKLAFMKKKKKSKFYKEVQRTLTCSTHAFPLTMHTFYIGLVLLQSFFPHNKFKETENKTKQNFQTKKQINYHWQKKMWPVEMESRLRIISMLYPNLYIEAVISSRAHQH